MYQALYRTWRPKVFEDVVGQDIITKTLRHQVESGKLAHAYLFTGSRGTGKTTCSKILAKAVNCLSPVEGDPCGICENCIAIEEGSMTDVLEMDAASNNSVEDVRALREEAIYPPAMGKYRVYIIDEVHMLSKNAFNALLKIMEEPPEWVIFVLATTEAQKIPITILSRLQRFDFQRVSAKSLAEQLLKIAKVEEIDLTEEAALLIGKIADGGVRDAISLLDQCATLGNQVNENCVRETAGLADKEQVYLITEAILEKDITKLLEQIAYIYERSVDFRPFTESLLEQFRAMMIVKSVREPDKILEVTQEEIDRLQKEVKNQSLTFLFFAVDLLQDLYYRLGTDRSALALFEMTMLKLCHPEYEQERQNVVEDVEKTEKGKINTKKPPKLIEAKEKLETIVEKDAEPSPILSNIEEVHAVVEVEGELFQWAEIISRIEKKNPPLFATLEGSKAFIKGDLLLIDAENPVFFDLMRGSEATKESLRQSILEITGKVYRLGPLKKGMEVQEKPKGFEAIRQAALDTGIEIDEK